MQLHPASVGGCSQECCPLLLIMTTEREGDWWTVQQLSHNM